MSLGAETSRGPQIQATGRVWAGVKRKLGEAPCQITFAHQCISATGV